MKLLRFAWLLLLLPLVYGASFLDINFSHKRSSGCPFCEAAVLEKQLLFSDGTVHILYDYKPVVKGHILVVPSRHVERFEELSSEEVSKIASAIRRVYGAVSTTLGMPDYLLLQKNGASAGRSQAHLHFHYLPRSKEQSEMRFIAKFFLAPYLKPLKQEELRRELDSLRPYF